MLKRKLLNYMKRLMVDYPDQEETIEKSVLQLLKGKRISTSNKDIRYDVIDGFYSTILNMSGGSPEESVCIRQFREKLGTNVNAFLLTSGPDSVFTSLANNEHCASDIYKRKFLFRPKAYSDLRRTRDNVMELINYPYRIASISSADSEAKLNRQYINVYKQFYKSFALIVYLYLSCNPGSKSNNVDKLMEGISPKGGKDLLDSTNAASGLDTMITQQMCMWYGLRSYVEEYKRQNLYKEDYTTYVVQSMVDELVMLLQKMSEIPILTTMQTPANKPYIEIIQHVQDMLQRVNVMHEKVLNKSETGLKLRGSELDFYRKISNK